MKATEEKELVRKIKLFGAKTLRTMLYSIRDKAELKRLVEIGETIEQGK